MNCEYITRENIKYRTSRREFFPCLLPHHHLNFNFFYEFRLSHWLLHPNEHSAWLDFQGQDGPSTSTATASVYLERPLSYDLVRQAVEAAVVSLSENGRQALVEHAWEEAVVAVEAAGAAEDAGDAAEYCIVDLDFQVVVRNHRIYEFEKLIRGSAAESSV